MSFLSDRELNPSLRLSGIFPMAFESCAGHDVTSPKGSNMLPATFPVDDRRAADRRPDPVCRICDGSDVQAVVRTEMAVYFRCYSCNRVWGEPKPLASKTIRDALESLTVG
jgi:hypothetical protein